MTMSAPKCKLNLVSSFAAQNVLIGRLHEICVKEEVLCEGEPLNMLIEGKGFRQEETIVLI